MDENEIFEALGVAPEQGQGENEPVGGRETARTVVDDNGGNDVSQTGSENQTDQETGGNDENQAAREIQDEQLPGGTPNGVSETGGENQGQDGDGDRGPSLPSDAVNDRSGGLAAAQQEAIDRAVQEAVARERESFQKEREQFYQAAGLKNTITGETITSDEQFRAWKSAFDAQRIAEDLEKGKLTPEAISRAVADSPAVKRLEELAASEEARNRQAQEARQREEEAKARERIDAELAEIHRMDPSINGVEDLLKMENADRFRTYVQRGNTFLDAYYLTNREKLAQQQAQAAQRQAQEAARSKDHLRSLAKPVGAGAKSVPKADMELFRLFNPDATEAEIQSYYNKQQQ